jgi:hypothetical protein
LNSYSGYAKFYDKLSQFLTPKTKECDEEILAKNKYKKEETYKSKLESSEKHQELAKKSFKLESIITQEMLDESAKKLQEMFYKKEVIK